MRDLVAALVSIESTRPLPAHPVEDAQGEADQDQQHSRGQAQTNIVSTQTKVVLNMVPVPSSNIWTNN